MSTVTVQREVAASKGLSGSNRIGSLIPKMAGIDVEYTEFYGGWNYTIHPINRSDGSVDS
jgi:hypothetical protein